jgi:hypothetical protein
LKPARKRRAHKPPLSERDNLAKPRPLRDAESCPHCRGTLMRRSKAFARLKGEGDCLWCALCQHAYDCEPMGAVR